jgi:ABC-2 type transport system ATP-binding protein
MIEVEHLVKDYGTVVAVRDVSFTVGKGEIVGFLGPNGAGKSTTLRILAGFLGATSGRVTVNGLDIVDDPLEARRCMGYMPEAVPLYPELRVGEYLEFRARLKRVPRRERRGAIDRASELAAVADMRDTLIGHLSKGYRQRVGLADALLAKPPLLILDEPTAGLDPNQIREVRQVIRDLRADHTILLSTHILSEVESTCDRAIVINRGKLVGQGTLDELKSRRAKRSVRVAVRDPNGLSAAVFDEAGVPWRIMPTSNDAGVERYELTLEGVASGDGDGVEPLIRALVEASVGVREVTPVKASLEQVFAALTEDGAASS